MASLVLEDGGADRNRTGVHGFAGRCVATPPPRHTLRSYREHLSQPVAKTRAFDGYGQDGIIAEIAKRPEALSRV